MSAYSQVLSCRTVQCTCSYIEFKLVTSLLAGYFPIVAEAPYYVTRGP